MKASKEKLTTETMDLDEVNPAQLDAISGGASVEGVEEEECGSFFCGSYNPKEH